MIAWHKTGRLKLFNDMTIKPSIFSRLKESRISTSGVFCKHYSLNKDKKDKFPFTHYSTKHAQSESWLREKFKNPFSSFTRQNSSWNARGQFDHSSTKSSTKHAQNESWLGVNSRIFLSPHQVKLKLKCEVEICRFLLTGDNNLTSGKIKSDAWHDGAF